jgi:hypothetical protein
VTLPPHRRRGLFRHLLACVRWQAVRAGLERLWIASVPGGAESALVATGFRPILEVRVLDLRWGRWLATRQAPGEDPRIVEAARGVLGVGGRSLRSRPPARRH